MPVSTGFASNRHLKHVGVLRPNPELHSPSVLRKCKARAIIMLQQHLPADSSLQQLLEPLLPAAVAGSSPASDAVFHSTAGMPGEDVATIAAPSTSLTGGWQTPEARAAAAAMAVTMVAPAPIDVQAMAVPSTWGQKEATQQQHSTPGSSPAVQLEQQAAEQRQDSKHWARVVGVCGFAALLSHLDRTNISTAMAQPWLNSLAGPVCLS
jgi:hypothetical protein